MGEATRNRLQESPKETGIGDQNVVPEAEWPMVWPPLVPVPKGGIAEDRVNVLRQRRHR
jgi:hypothetical protein